VIDIIKDPRGLEQLRAMGLRHVPVLARGRDYVFAQNLQEVAKFVGLKGTGYTSLPADQLVARYRLVMRAAQRYLRQMSQDVLDSRAIDIRDRPVRVLGHHVFRICEAFLESVVDGAHLSLERLIFEPGPGEFTTGESITQYADGVIERLDAWWDGARASAARACPASTYYGPQTVDELLERCTWHSAHHVRQLMAVLDRLHIESDRRLTAADLRGLPMPDKIWD
jgi:hypothetical protein